MDAEHLIYLYCVTEQPPDLESVGEPPGELYLVGEAGLYAVVSRVAAGPFEPSRLRRSLEDLDWVVAETTKHEEIVEAVMRDHGLIPFRFATLFRTEDNLRTRLRTHAEQFKTLLAELEGKAEWGVKVLCDMEKLRSSVRAQDGPVADLDEAIQSASPGRAFFLKKKCEDLADAAAAGRIDRYVARIVETLQTISFQTRVNQVWPAGASQAREAMILNAAFLVGRPNARTFVDTAQALNERYADQNLLVECTGPWPPYNFCALAGTVADE